MTEPEFVLTVNDIDRIIDFAYAASQSLLIMSFPHHPNSVTVETVVLESDAQRVLDHFRADVLSVINPKKR